MTTVGNVSAGGTIQASWGNAVTDFVNGENRLAVAATSGTTAYLSSGGSVAAFVSGTLTASQDDNSWVSGSQVTPDEAGFYLVTASFEFTGGFTATDRLAVQISKNGSTIVGAWDGYAGTAAPRRNCSGIITMNGTTDYFILRGFQDSGGNRTAATSIAVYRLVLT